MSTYSMYTGHRAGVFVTGNILCVYSGQNAAAFVQWCTVHGAVA